MATTGLKNVNMLTKEQYDGVSVPANDELWAVETETYSDEFGNWYRVYPDGWCEQGGLSSSTTVTLLKPYKDTNYTVMKTVLYNNTGNCAFNQLGYISTKTNESFTWTGTTTINYWIARGYIA